MKNYTITVNGNVYDVVVADGASTGAVAAAPKAAPKKKKRKHLAMKPVVFEGIAEKFATGAKVFDAEIASAIIASTTTE